MARVLGVRANTVIAVAFALSRPARRRGGGPAHRPDRHRLADDGRQHRALRVHRDGRRRHGEPRGAVLGGFLDRRRSPSRCRRRSRSTSGRTATRSCSRAVLARARRAAAGPPARARRRSPARCRAGLACGHRADGALADAIAPAPSAAGARRRRARRGRLAAGRLIALTCLVALAAFSLGPDSLDRVVLGDGDQPDRSSSASTCSSASRASSRSATRPSWRSARTRRDPRHPAGDEAFVLPDLPGLLAGAHLEPLRRRRSLVAGCRRGLRARALRSAGAALGPDRGPRDIRSAQHRERRRAQLGAGDARHGRRVRHPDDDDDRGRARLGARRDRPRPGCSSDRASACGCAPRARTRPPRARSASALARERTIAFVLSAFFVGVAGALFGMFIGSFNPDAFFLNITFLMVAMLVIGGMTSLAGAVVGTLAISAVLGAPAPDRERRRPRIRRSCSAQGRACARSGSRS